MKNLSQYSYIEAIFKHHGLNTHTTLNHGVLKINLSTTDRANIAKMVIQNTETPEIDTILGNGNKLLNTYYSSRSLEDFKAYLEGLGDDILLLINNKSSKVEYVHFLGLEATRIQIDNPKDLKVLGHKTNKPFYYPWASKSLSELFIG